MIDDAEALFDHTLQIDTAPAHHAIVLPIRTRLDQGFQFGLLGGIQTAGRPRVLIVVQAIGSFGIEAVNPVTQCLAVHAAHARSVRMPAARRKSPQVRGRIVIP